jgi:SAM-dependent methyltransferase
MEGAAYLPNVPALTRTGPALNDGWLPGSGRGLDVGCGLGTEAGYLASVGWRVAGIDLSATALRRGRRRACRGGVCARGCARAAVCPALL